MARILIVDDTKNIRKMVELTLKGSGHETETAVDGEEGLARFGDGANWDLMIVDQQMPKMEGRDLIRAARQRDPQARVMMMTAFATGDLASEVMQAGALDFLRKPFTTQVLRGAVEAALAHPKELASQTGMAPDSTDSTTPNKVVMPRVSYRFNGYSFWPLPQSSTRTVPQGLATGTTFQVRYPSGQLSECFVGVTRHIQQEVESEFGDASQEQYFWENLCGMALSEFFWNQAQTPPAVLTVFDVPKKLTEARRSPVSWGPFTHGR